MVEKLQNYEQNEQSNEALENLASERRAEIEKSLERGAETTQERDVEALTTTAEKAAEVERKQEDHPAKARERVRDTPAQRRTKAKASFKKTMKETQDHMNPAERTFSKVIHTPAVEKTSEAVGSTVARPNAILAGAFSAFVFTLAIYLVARHYGYPLSGAESIASFIIGWAVGLLFDYIRVMATGKRI